jgi:PTS system galactitol-specific IIC component
MMPVLITILGLVFRQSFAKSVRAGLTVGVGFVAIGLVVDLLVHEVGPKAQSFAKVLGVHLDTLDVGWPMGATVSFASPIAAALIPTIVVLNIVLVLFRLTKTIDIDLWNYWHFIYTGALVQAATGSIVVGVLGACVTAIVVLKLADWTAPAVEHHFGLKGISLPHTETVNWAPLMYALDRVLRKVPLLRRVKADPVAVRAKLGLLGEPIVLGAILGVVIGALGAVPLWRAGRISEGVKDTATLAVTMAAVLVVLPKVVAILMEGLLPISEGARAFLQKRFPGRKVLIGLDAAVVIGHPANMAVALVCIPLALLIAMVLPGNRMLPFGDLAALPFYILWGVAAARGNMVRGLINALVTIVLILWIGTSLGPLTTDLAKAAHFAPKDLGADARDYPYWSGVALGSHLVPWIVVQLVTPGSTGFWIGALAAVAFALIWLWVRKDIRREYAQEIAKAEEEERAAAKGDAA